MSLIKLVTSKCQVFLQKEKSKNKVKLTNQRHKFHECEIT